MENRHVFGAAAAAWLGIVGYQILKSPEWKRRKMAARKSTSPKVTIIGDIFCDIIATNVSEIPPWGSDAVIPNPMSIRSGGSGLNTAVWLSAMSYESQGPSGVHVRVPRTFGQLSQEPPELATFTSGIEDTLVGNGITIVDPQPDAELMEDIDSTSEQDRLKWTTGTCICISGASDRSFITYQGGNGSFMYRDFFLPKLVPTGTRHIHIAGYYNCPSIWGERTEDFIKDCRENRKVKTISLNPQYGKGWGGDIHRLIGLVDFFICNVDEACGITGERDLVNAINKLVDEYACPCAVVTMGSEGALLRQRKTTESYSQVDPRREPVRVLCKEIIDSPLIDTVGVGDAFCGGFLFEIVNRDLNPYSPDLPEAVRFGCACGSAALTVIGGSTFPGLAQVRECLID